MEQVTIETPAGPVHLETGRIARQADGAVVLRHGETVLLATAVAAAAPRPGADFFPLTVEYRERLAAAGRIPGSYQRREGRIRTRKSSFSRLADRSIRPLFPEQFTAETQVLLSVLSADGRFRRTSGRSSPPRPRCICRTSRGKALLRRADRPRASVSGARSPRAPCARQPTST